MRERVVRTTPCRHGVAVALAAVPVMRASRRPVRADRLPGSPVSLFRRAARATTSAGRGVAAVTSVCVGEGGAL